MSADIFIAYLNNAVCYGANQFQCCLIFSSFFADIRPFQTVKSQKQSIISITINGMAYDDSERMLWSPPTAPFIFAIPTLNWGYGKNGLSSSIFVEMQWIRKQLDELHRNQYCLGNRCVDCRKKEKKKEIHSVHIDCPAILIFGW